MLNVDLSKLDTKEKKEAYGNISNTFQTNVEKIYNATMDSKEFIVADIWRLFKNDALDYCVESDEAYRNKLVILTDGYIYHPDTQDKIKNRTSYIGTKFIGRFKNNNKWKEQFEKQDFGLINAREGKNDLSNLEILVLEVAAVPNQKDDEDIIKAYLEKWFAEMGAVNNKVYNSDLPEYTKTRIEKFLGEYVSVFFCFFSFL